MARPSHPPAWYPDPGRPDRVRRWNGRAWTSEVRPRPPWLRTLRLSPGPPAKVPRTTTRLWATSAALLVLGGVVMVALGRQPPTPAERISDRTFVLAANQRCAETAEAVVEPNRRPLRGAAEVERYHRLAAGWEDMVVDLRALPLSPLDDAAVDGWLRAWDRWTSLGHDYADALAAEDEAEASRIIERSQPAKAAMTAFALTNDMPACIFR